MWLWCINAYEVLNMENGKRLYFLFLMKWHLPLWSQKWYYLTWLGINSFLSLMYFVFSYILLGLLDFSCYNIWWCDNVHDVFAIRCGATINSEVLILSTFVIANLRKQIQCFLVKFTTLGIYLVYKNRKNT